MNCLEVIGVRIAQENKFDDALRICKEASLPVNAGNFLGLEVYRSDGYGSDIIILIRWSYEPCEQKKSLMGLQIARGLSRYGIVSHALWIDQQIHIPLPTAAKAE